MNGKARSIQPIHIGINFAGRGELSSFGVDVCAKSRGEGGKSKENKKKGGGGKGGDGGDRYCEWSNGGGKGIGASTKH